MRSRLRWLALAGAATAVISAWAFGPLLLRRVAWFEVRRVEVSGARLLMPQAVLAASGIRRGQNIWEDRVLWEEALVAHPVVESARVGRRLPATLRIQVREKRPVAFVELGALHPATAAGEILPALAPREPLDLPIVRTAGADSAQAITRRALAEIGRLEQLDPVLMREVSEVWPVDTGAGALVLWHRLAEIVVPEGADAGRLAELRRVLDDLERRLGEQPAGPARVDLRYRDQIVVRLPSSV